MFITSLVTMPGAKGKDKKGKGKAGDVERANIPIALPKTIDLNWFLQHWNTDYSTEIEKRLGPVKYLRKPTAEQTINDIVFEPLGSKTNVVDLVLCDEQINSAKGRLWDNKNPWDPDTTKNKFKDAARTLTDKKDPFSIFRSVRIVVDFLI
jgi:hypothetical protein